MENFREDFVNQLNLGECPSIYEFLQVIIEHETAHSMGVLTGKNMEDKKIGGKAELGDEYEKKAYGGKVNIYGK